MTQHRLDTVAKLRDRAVMRRSDNLNPIRLSIIVASSISKRHRPAAWRKIDALSQKLCQRHPVACRAASSKSRHYQSASINKRRVLRLKLRGLLEARRVDHSAAADVRIRGDVRVNA